MKPRASNGNGSTAYEARIDAALQAYGGAVPAPGLESRVAARIAAAPRPFFHASPAGLRQAGWLVWLRGVAVGALGAAAACAIVVGTVRHSQQAAIPWAARVPRPEGVSASGATHVPTHAVAQSATINPQAPRSAPHGRATVPGNAGKRAAGSAVPQSPYPPGQEPSSEPQ
jgi:hypothetical protein